MIGKIIINITKLCLLFCYIIKILYMDITTTVNMIYKHKKHHQGFFSQYGGDLIIALIIIYLFMIASTYYYVLNHIPDLQEKWPKEKCNPLYIPFAGLVMPHSKKTNLELIDENFQGCIQNILTSISDDALAPINYALSVVNSIVQEATDAIQSVRGMFNKIRTDIKDTSENISGRTLNIMIPFMEMTIYIRNIMGMVQGNFAAAIYTLLGTFLTLKSAIGSIIEIIIKLIIIPLIIAIIITQAIPFVGFALAAPQVIVVLAITIALIPIRIMFNKTFGGHSSIIPGL